LEKKMSVGVAEETAAAPSRQLGSHALEDAAVISRGKELILKATAQQKVRYVREKSTAKLLSVTNQTAHEQQDVPLFIDSIDCHNAYSFQRRSLPLTNHDNFEHQEEPMHYQQHVYEDIGPEHMPSAPHHRAPPFPHRYGAQTTLDAVAEEKGLLPWTPG